LTDVNGSHSVLHSRIKEVGMDVKEPAAVDLAQLGDEALEELTPAMRAAIERVYSADAAEGPGGFNSFVDADL
jgi:hypothetical protein